MAECPFCASEVDDDLIVFGGTCPICFGEIPGEEAPTDPGEDVRRQQEQEDARGLRLHQTIRVGVLGVALIGAIAVTAAIALWPDPVLPPIDFDALEMQQPTQLVAYVADEPDEAVPKASGTSGTRPTHTASNTNSSVVGSPLLHGLPSDEFGTDMGDVELGQGQQITSSGVRTTRTGTGDVQAAEIHANLAVGTSQGLTDGPALSGLDVSVDRDLVEGERLRDPQQIIRHISQVQNREVRKLTQCYQQRLKLNEELEGRWRLEYVVGREGRVKNAHATGLQMSDAEFETCLVERVMTWQFLPLVADQPVTKSVEFRPRF